jgi:hypothetical protein
MELQRLEREANYLLTQCHVVCVTIDGVFIGE